MIKKTLDKQEIYLRNLIQARQLGITSRFTAYLMYRCERLAGEQEKLEKGKSYKHLLTYKDLML